MESCLVERRVSRQSVSRAAHNDLACISRVRASGIRGLWGGSLGSLGPLGLASVARERLRALADAGRKQVRVDDV